MTFVDNFGIEAMPSEIKRPMFCQMCERSNDPADEIVCDLIRLSQAGSILFKCTSFVSLYGVLIDGIILERPSASGG